MAEKNKTHDIKLKMMDDNHWMATTDVTLEVVGATRKVALRGLAEKLSEYALVVAEMAGEEP